MFIVSIFKHVCRLRIFHFLWKLVPLFDNAVWKKVLTDILVTFFDDDVIFLVLTGVGTMSILNEREIIFWLNITGPTDYLVALYLITMSTTIFEGLHT